MKLIVILSALFTSAIFVEARSAVRQIRAEEAERKQWMVIEGKQGRLHYLNLKQQIPRLHVDDSVVTFHYCSRYTDSTTFSVDTVQDIHTVDFNPERRTMFIIHGWNNDKGSEINQLIGPALLRADDWNVFIVDWREPANTGYTTAKGSVNGVGEIVARFIRSLTQIAGLKLDKVILLGHSLGAHVAGHASTMLNSEIAIIVGLDPAMPFFSYTDLDERLDPSDAQHVQVVHTNGGFLGFLKPLGHADFYPNGGMNQNGCGVDLLGTCAHSRSYMYFEESLSNQFTATSCPDIDAWKAGDCDANEQVHMGGNFLNVRASGSYYLETAARQPFAL